ncbi:MAG: transporter substrate-binding domain-containing protein [Oceanibaculum nanhaiense]|uniref:transporter substrate-binding domain-containing protein n=1 Tax=Oceanibaculum nanhaiense TaxID=1909734 RepID=UPI0025A37C44|nr:transporter substrate-binding domain-containing protein [Oceanibaculum nanhaiense]MDM7945145.1 transporter substrate-binding domain-containing protein [Oceanibaculum nanhaiense]
MTIIPRIALLTFLGLSGSATTALAAETIRIGGYPFPPFVEVIDGQPGGLTLDLIAATNKAQTRYRLDFVPTVAEQRYSGLSGGKFDLIAFESPDWGWPRGNIATGDTLHEGSEIYVALAQPDRDQSFFANLAERHIAIVSGFHYGFTGMGTNGATRRFDILETAEPGDGLQAVLDGEAEIAVLNDVFLKRLLAEVPEMKETLLIGETPDQRYSQTVIGNARRAEMVNAIGRLLLDTMRAPDFRDVLRGYGLSEP